MKLWAIHVLSNSFGMRLLMTTLPWRRFDYLTHTEKGVSLIRRKFFIRRKMRTKETRNCSLLGQCNERPGMEKIAKLCRERQAWKNVGKLFTVFVFASSV